MIAASEKNDKYLDLLKSVLCASLYDESAWQTIDGPMKYLSGSGGIADGAKRWVIKLLRSKNLKVVRTLPFDSHRRQNGLDWPLFGYTMTGRTRLDVLERCLTDVIVDNVPGDIAETGVWRGGSMMLARAVLDQHGDTTRKIWLADSFEGMPVPTETDPTKSKDENFSDRDYLVATVDQVEANFRRFGLFDDRIKFLKGWFSETLPRAPIERLSLLRLDGDLYESTIVALEALYDKLSVGGYLIVDDYYSWAGCKRAVDEFRNARNITDPITDIDAHAIYWRRAA